MGNLLKNMFHNPVVREIVWQCALVVLDVVRDQAHKKGVKQLKA